MPTLPRRFHLQRHLVVEGGQPDSSAASCCTYQEYGTRTALGSPFFVTTVGSSRKYAASIRWPSSARRSRMPMEVSSLMRQGYSEAIVYTVYMSEESCIGAGCDRPAWSKGMCNSHYERQRRYGDARLDIPVGSIIRPPRSLCTIEGCDKRAHGRGWCSTHYKRWQDHGDPHREPPEPAEGCAWSEPCDRPHHAYGLCATHYQRRFSRRAYLKYTYQMSEAQWQELFNAQGQRCPVCLRAEPPGESVWHVHHDHRCCPGARSCGQCVIAILCGPCNIGMGGLGDDPDRLERAAELMRRGGAR